MKSTREIAIRARNTTWLGFGLLGVLSNAWVPRIPEVKHALHLSNSQFGLSLAAGPAGAVIGAQLAGRFIHKFGSRWVLVLGGLEMASGIFMLGMATTQKQLMFAIFLQSIGYGCADTALNTQGVAVEVHTERKYMSGFHGAWSVGALLAVVSGGILSHHISTRANICGAAVIAFMTFIPTIFTFLPESLDRHEGDEAGLKGKIKLFERKTFILWALGFGLLGCLIPEAAAMDWSGILLHEHMGLQKGVDSIAFAVFGITMIIGRFSGDKLMMKFGAEKVVKLGGYIGGICMGVSIALAVPLASWNKTVALIIISIGFGIAGFGIAPMVPAFISAAGKIPGIAPSVAIARIGIIGIFSYFMGPTIIGGLADLVTLPGAMAFPVGVLLLAGYLSRTVRAQEVKQ